MMNNPVTTGIDLQQRGRKGQSVTVAFDPCDNHGGEVGMLQPRVSPMTSVFQSSERSDLHLSNEMPCKKVKGRGGSMLLSSSRGRFLGLLCYRLAFESMQHTFIG